MGQNLLGRHTVKWVLCGAITAFMITGCDDVMGVIDPCSRDGACEVEGVSFVVDELTSNGTLIQDVNRRFLPAGSELEIGYVIRNRGSESSEAVDFRICLSTGRNGVCSDLRQVVSTGSLSPGERATGTIRFNVPNTVSGERNVVAYWIQRRNQAELREPVVLELPDFQADVALSVGEAPAGEPLQLEVTVRNTAFVSSAPSSRAGACLTGGTPPRCLFDQGMQYFDVPGLAPGEAWTDTIPFVTPLAALAFPDDRTNRRVSVQANANQSVTEQSTSRNWDHAQYTAYPNLDMSYDVVSIEVGAISSGMLTPGGCGLRWNRGVNVYRTELVEGRAYSFRISSQDDTPRYWSGLVLDGRGTQVTQYSNIVRASERALDFTPNSSGVHYLVVGYGNVHWHSSAGQLYDATVVER